MKFLEGLLMEELNGVVLNWKQFGFAKGKGIEEAKCVLAEKLVEYRLGGFEPHIFFLDLQNAYNSVDRDRLYKKLEVKGLFDGWKMDLLKFIHYNSRVRLGKVST